MEIIRKGKFKTYLFPCQECGCMFSANSSEVLEYTTILGDTFPVMLCPFCKVKRVLGDEITQQELDDLGKED